MEHTLKVRLIGLAVIAVGVAFGWFFVLGPLEGARAGAAQVKYSVKSFLVVSMCMVVGLMVLLGGPSVAANMLGPPKTRQQWIIVISVLVVTFAGAGLNWWWFAEQMKVLGYGGR